MPYVKIGHKLSNEIRVEENYLENVDKFALIEDGEPCFERDVMDAWGYNNDYSASDTDDVEFA